MKDTDFCRLGRAVLETEAAAITALLPRVDHDFATACRLLLDCQGRVVVIGMGKSGHVAGKLAATLASTGTPAFFVHPGEASHGDLGMITPGDVVIALSNSGETEEINQLLPLIKRLGNALVAITGNPDSTLAATASVHLNVAVDREACPLGLAPTASTTASLAMGDALAIALLDARGFTSEDFARSHPGGRLGRRLLLRIADLMHADDTTPRVSPDTPLAGALLEMTRKGLGMTAVCNAEGEVIGIFTDGDLRRALDEGVDVHETPIEAVMTPNPRLATQDQLAAEALALMERHSINALLVTDTHGRLTGALNMHDLLRAGVM
ncbi:KpsF/GutQ family sugar-phosphate isomerase [Spiribacter salinus]|uniref:KpsF/GutQ family sugar-phosphate isomerase n=1 Tax=Spiribacter salinus TaxID=1335746 RepID=UPI001C94AFEC|nr:KpsF/GutQ family sugar-phosphate isomerase [Spiribacter salinus]MBY5269079.1 D-arabinose 5-phosphate isomerase [Spiribacter salinus]